MLIKKFGQRNKKVCNFMHINYNKFLMHFQADPVTSSKAEGRRIIDNQYFFNQMIEISQHSYKFGCQMTYLKTIEEQRNGFFSKFVLKCSMCGSIFY